jgi:hypothetical protein
VSYGGLFGDRKFQSKQKNGYPKVAKRLLNQLIIEAILINQKIYSRLI